MIRLMALMITTLLFLAGLEPVSYDFTPASYDSVKNCHLFISGNRQVFVKLNSKSTLITELKNGIIYIEGKGFLNLRNGDIYNIKDSIDRLNLYRTLGDSILYFRTQREQVVMNLLTDYFYYRRKWLSKIFNTLPVAESCNGSVIPVFDNDSTVFITSIRDNRILLKLSGFGLFHNKVYIYDNHIFLSDNGFCYKISMNGNIVLKIPLARGIASDILFVNKKLFFWNSGSGLEAYDEAGVLAWRYNSQINNGYVKLVRQNDKVYFNDGNLKSINLNNGNILWSRVDEPLATDNNNFVVTDKYIITGLYHDSDASIVLIDKFTGKLICDGFDMENEVGFDRYIFFNFLKGDSFFVKDAGGYGYDIVKMNLK